MQKKVCLADFFWNLGRTLPHAILTVFLLYQGSSLTQIALLQSIYMVVVMFTEFPSGVWADRFSRKKIYLLSLIILLLAYLLIGFYSTNYIILCIAYALYGLSVSLKSGTLEADAVLELTEQQKPIKEFSVILSYVTNVSSIIGGLCGSFLYSFFLNKIYFVSIILFAISFIIALSCGFVKEERNAGALSLKSELKDGYEIIKESDILKYILLLFGIMTLFLQPFYQYWQVLYDENNVPEAYFGIIYVIFQLCGIIGTYIYKHCFNNKKFNAGIILIIIPLVYALGLLIPNGTTISLILAVIVFNIYSIHIDVVQKENAPAEHISSFFSLAGTVDNIFSIISLFIMAFLTESIGVEQAYLVEFALFACFAIIVTSIFNKGERK